MTLGTLRDQVIYPDMKDDQERKNITDKQLEDILDLVSTEKSLLVWYWFDSADKIVGCLIYPEI